MKKIFVSASLAAIGAAGLQSLSAGGLDLPSPKMWSISGTLRGFYDDNYNIAATKKGSWGGEISPSVSLNVPLRQTDVGIRYYYGLYYYADRDDLGVDAFDQSHQIEVWLDHAFNSKWKLKFTDHLGIGQEPELIQPDPLTGNPINYRLNGNNLSNHARLTLDTQWTSRFGTTLSYGNDFYDYENSGGSITNSASFPAGVYQSSPVRGNSVYGNNPNQFAGMTGTGASLSGLLDRVDQNIGLDFNWTFSPKTTVSLGYGFSWSQYLGNEPVSVYNYYSTSAAAFQSYVYDSSSRDGTSHDLHVGLNHELTANLILAFTLGVSYSDNDENPFDHNTTFAPSANLSLSYTYIPGSYVQLGVSHGQNATDQIQPGTDGSITQYQRTTTVYADLNHHITEKFTGTLIGRFTYATFEGGAASPESEYNYNVGVNFNYQFNRHFSADAGYNFDDLVSGLTGRSFVRNRVYLGLSANY